MTNLIQKAESRKSSRPPVWLMRQAGRYLPEYRDIRAKAGDFVSLCLNPELACEVTLQPIRRFGFDASIIFSDILMIPYAMGQKLWFAEGEGPRLGELNWHALDVASLEPVYEAIRLTRANLPKETNLIGFAGAPWTLLLYGLQGKGGEGFEPAKRMISADVKFALDRINDLIPAIVEHLSNQVNAGCDTLQLFDSWAGLCPAEWHEDFIVKPAQAIIAALHERHPAVKIIAFPKGFEDLTGYQVRTKADAISFGQFVKIKPMENCVVQGNLDPQILIEGGEGLDRAVDEILLAMEGKAHIFNLGHGIDKTTPIAHVEQMLKRIRA